VVIGARRGGAGCIAVAEADVTSITRAGGAALVAEGRHSARALQDLVAQVAVAPPEPTSNIGPHDG
jgi:hypothetical protein